MSQRYHRGDRPWEENLPGFNIKTKNLRAETKSGCWGDKEEKKRARGGPGRIGSLLPTRD